MFKAQLLFYGWVLKEERRPESQWPLQGHALMTWRPFSPKFSVLCGILSAKHLRILILHTPWNQNNLVPTYNLWTPWCGCGGGSGHPWCLFSFSLVCHCALQTSWPLNLIFYLRGPFLIRSSEFQDTHVAWFLSFYLRSSTCAARTLPIEPSPQAPQVRISDRTVYNSSGQSSCRTSAMHHSSRESMARMWVFGETHVHVLPGKQQVAKQSHDVRSPQDLAGSSHPCPFSFSCSPTDLSLRQKCVFM